MSVSPAQPEVDERDLPPRILRRRHVVERTGLSPTTLAQLVKRGLFPAPVQLTARSFGWVEAEVDHWIAERVRTRDSGAEDVDPVLQADLARVPGRLAP
jgi:prophage regulatory protein